MATELTWASDVNKTVADQTTTAKAAAWEAWYLLASLVGNTNTALSGNAGNWTLYASSDSVTAGIDSTDRLGITGSATFDSTKFVAAAANTAHTWCTLKSPVNFGVSGGYTYFTLDMNSGTNGNWSYAFSKTAPAAITQNGTTTNGSTSVTSCTVTTAGVDLLPGMSVTGTGIQSGTFISSASSGSTTVTLTQNANGSGTNALTFSGSIRSRYTAVDEWWYNLTRTFSNNSVAVNRRISIHLSTRGDFWVYEAPDNNSSKPYAVLGCLKLQNAHSADVHPVVSVFTGDNVTDNANYGLMIGGTRKECLSGTLNTMLKARNYNGTSSLAWYVPALAVNFSPSDGTLASVITQSSMGAANLSDGTYNALPLAYVFNDTNGQAEVKGRIPDMLYASYTANLGTTIPSSTPYEYVKIGNVFLPWVSSSSPTF